MLRTCYGCKELYINLSKCKKAMDSLMQASDPKTTSERRRAAKQRKVGEKKAETAEVISKEKLAAQRAQLQVRHQGFQLLAPIL